MEENEEQKECTASIEQTQIAWIRKLRGGLEMCSEGVERFQTSLENAPGLFDEEIARCKTKVVALKAAVKALEILT